MTNEKPVTISAETVRRMALNAEANPRETVYGEATQTLNPLTGRAYADGRFMSEAEIVRIKNIPIYHPFKDENLSSIIYCSKDLNFPRFKKKPRISQSRTNEEIKLQRVLGRMEVREGKLPDFVFGEFLDDVEKLTDLYAQNPDLTLDSITDVTGLNAAIWAMQRERVRAEEEKDLKTLITNYNFDRPILRFDNLEKRIIGKNTLENFILCDREQFIKKTEPRF